MKQFFLIPLVAIILSLFGCNNGSRPEPVQLDFPLCIIDFFEKIQEGEALTPSMFLDYDQMGRLSGAVSMDLSMFWIWYEVSYTDNIIKRDVYDFSRQLAIKDIITTNDGKIVRFLRNYLETGLIQEVNYIYDEMGYITRIDYEQITLDGEVENRIFNVMTDHMGNPLLITSAENDNPIRIVIEISEQALNPYFANISPFINSTFCNGNPAPDLHLGHLFQKLPDGWTVNGRSYQYNYELNEFNLPEVTYSTDLEAGNDRKYNWYHYNYNCFEIR